MNPPVQICSFFSAVRVASHSRWRCFLKKYLVVFFSNWVSNRLVFLYTHDDVCDGCPNWLCKIRWHQSKSVAYTLSLAIPYTQLSKTFSKWYIYNFICRVVQFFRFQIISGHPKTRVTIFSVIAVEAEKKWFRRDVTRKFNILTGLPAADWLTIESSLCCAVLCWPLVG
jgi:hypothetical protein